MSKTVGHRFIDYISNKSPSRKNPHKRTFISSTPLAPSLWSHNNFLMRSLAFPDGIGSSGNLKCNRQFIICINPKLEKWNKPYLLWNRKLIVICIYLLECSHSFSRLERRMTYKHFIHNTSKWHDYSMTRNVINGPRKYMINMTYQSHPIPYPFFDKTSGAM